MALAALDFDERLLAYLGEIGPLEHPALADLRQATASHEHANMQSAPEQMALISLLLKLSGARRVLEVGCFTGYGTLAMALALPENGHVTTLDVNDDWAAIGRPFWQQAGVAHRIEFKSGLAHESLTALKSTGLRFDAIYIDADKKSYVAYLEAALELVEVGGLIALDNMLWGGAVADPDDTSKQVQALREVASTVRDDARLTSCLIPIADGLMLVRKEI